MEARFFRNSAKKPRPIFCPPTLARAGAFRHIAAKYGLCVVEKRNFRGRACAKIRASSFSRALNARAVVICSPARCRVSFLVPARSRVRGCSGLCLFPPWRVVLFVPSLARGCVCSFPGAGFFLLSFFAGLFFAVFFEKLFFGKNILNRYFLKNVKKSFSN